MLDRRRVAAGTHVDVDHESLRVALFFGFIADSGGFHHQFADIGRRADIGVFAQRPAHQHGHQLFPGGLRLQRGAILGRADGVPFEGELFTDFAEKRVLFDNHIIVFGNAEIPENILIIPDIHDKFFGEFDQGHLVDIVGVVVLDRVVDGLRHLILSSDFSGNAIRMVDATSSIGQRGVLQFATPAMLEAQELQRSQAAAAAYQQQQQTAPTQLVGYIRSQFEIFRNHRNTAESGWSERLLVAMRTFNGEYSPTQLNEIKKFGGSQVYARLTAQKCRAASSLLRDVYLGADKPYAIKPPAYVEVPPQILQSINRLLAHEHQMIIQTTGQPPPIEAEMERRMALVEAAEEQAKKKAREQAQIAEDRIETYLREGLFYHALAEFLVDLPVFPFAVLKGPMVKIMPKVMWPQGGGKPTIQQIPQMMWARVSPFDIWWTPGVADIANANVIEKSQLTRAEINALLDLPGYNTAEVYAALQDYGRGGYYDYWDTTDAERAVLESRENPAWNRSGMITQIEFHGNVFGECLLDYGVQGVEDPYRDYHIDAYCLGPHVIKVNLNPSPRSRHNYFITSFEKVPGTPVGNGLVDLVADLQSVANATLRSLVNNMSIASGPQVVVNDDRCRPEDNTDELYPWKRWHVRNDPVGNNAKPPVEFFQPQGIAQQLLEVFKAFVDLSDDVSAIPKYIGGQAGGGAGRTASGLAMLMGNASKILQTVAANIDREIFEPALQQLVDLILLTDTTGLLSGEEDVSVQGVNVAVQRETQRQRQLEFLQHTNNPTDMHIVGIKGRGAVLRSVAQTIGLDGEEVVPDDAALEKKEKEQEAGGQGKALEQKVDEGIQQGVELGVQQIAKELTAGLLASHGMSPTGQEPNAQTLSEGNNPPPGPGGATAQTGPSAGGIAQRAAQAQGAQAQRPNQQSAMQTHVVGNQISQQPGQRLRPPEGGPG